MPYHSSQSCSSMYGPQVRVGNWYEENCLHAYKMNHLEVLRQKGDLLVDKARHLLENFQQKIVLQPAKKTVNFGTTVQLISPFMNICDNPRRDLPLALSVLLGDQNVYYTQEVCDQCEVTVAPSPFPCMRNCFDIVRVPGDETHADCISLRYGQQFRLQCSGSKEDPLFLYCAPRPLDMSMKVSSLIYTRHMGEHSLPLGVIYSRQCGPGTDTPSKYMNFFIQHLNPALRYEMEGEPVPNNEPLVITNTVRNTNLAVETTRVETLFGVEYPASLKNYKNIYKRELWNNIWLIQNGIEELTPKKEMKFGERKPEFK